MATNERCERCRVFVFDTVNHRGRQLCRRCFRKRKGSLGKAVVAWVLLDHDR